MGRGSSLWSDLVGGKYTRDVLVALAGSEAHRLGFNELKSELSGISSKTLSRTLKIIVRYRLATRHVQKHPYRVSYEVVGDGLALLKIIQQVEEWEKNRGTGEAK